MQNHTEFSRKSSLLELAKGPKLSLGYDEHTDNFATVRVYQSPIDYLLEIELKFFPFIEPALDYLDSFRKHSKSRPVLVVTIPSSTTSLPHTKERNNDYFDDPYFEEFTSMRESYDSVVPPRLRAKLSSHDF